MKGGNRMKPNVKNLFCLTRKVGMVLLALFFVQLFFVPKSVYTQDATGSFEFDGHTREYEVYFPQNFESNMPLVIALHGIYETVKWFKDYTHLHEVADTSGFIIVYPKGLGQSWRVGPDSIDSRRTFPKTDDVGFISALIDTMHAYYDVDLTRVYCCGFSTGGEMTFRMAGECGQRFAAVAGIASSLFDEANKWQRIHPMPVLQMHGTGFEAWYPYDEGFEGIWHVPDMIEYWLNTNQCSSQSDTLFFPDIVPEDNCTVQKISYTDCDNENIFVHYKVINGGHTWPPYPLGTWKATMDINANIEILNFFKNCQNPMTDLAYGKSINIFPVYIPPGSDTPITVTAQIANPEDHPVTVVGLIKGENSSFEDSVQLFDDGLHEDGQAEDNQWGGSKGIEDVGEDLYTVSFLTRDLEENITHNIHLTGIKYFTSIGPVIWDESEYNLDDLVQYNDSLYTLKISLKNEGSILTISDITARLSSSDPNVSEIINSSNPQSFPDIEPQQSVECTGVYAFYAQNNPEVINFKLEISSEGHHFWTDSLQIVTAGPAQSGAWVKKEDIPTARCFASSCELNGKIYVIGGGQTIDSRLDVMEVYDQATDTWDTTKTAMPTARAELCVAAVNGKIYAIGGAYSHSGSTLGMVEVYDPQTDTWDTDKTPMPTARKGAACAVMNNKIYVAGGSAETNFTPSNKLEIYDPATDEWTSGSDMLAGRYDTEGAVVNDTFYVIGGLIGAPWTGQGAVQKYDPITDHWEWATPLNDGRVGHTANVVNDKIYVIGGDGQPPFRMNVEEYNPQTEIWTVIDTIPSAMNIHTSSVYENKIYVFSGSTGDIWNISPTKNVYSFDPALVVDFIEIPKNQTPDDFVLHQNYPNPFNPVTTIGYQLSVPNQVELSIYNTLGQKVTTLVSQKQPAGKYQVQWNASGFASGVYYYRLEAGEFVDVKKMILIR
jgi:poly(3-hydroxybutyrate) depolymerase/N-acetylneuraminic acid mutarotase